MILRTGTKICIEYDFCSHREYQVAVFHKVKSFQQTGSFATGSLNLKNITFLSSCIGGQPESGL